VLQVRGQGGDAARLAIVLLEELIDEFLHRHVGAKVGRLERVKRAPKLLFALAPGLEAALVAAVAVLVVVAEAVAAGLLLACSSVFPPTARCDMTAGLGGAGSSASGKETRTSGDRQA
jgi:hypothetical protein